MNDKLYRHVLFKDLEDYLRKDNYLGGYTSTEQNWIRKNIGALSLKDAQAILDRLVSGLKTGTYKEISRLARDKLLIPGFVYIITDYLTIYLSHEKNSVGLYITWGDKINPSEVYNLILIAYSDSSFLKRINVLSSSEKSLEWDVLYQLESELLSDGSFTKGRILYLEDENHNRANYDFKNIRHSNGYTFEKDGVEGSRYYTWNEVNGVNISFKDISHHNRISGDNVIILSSINNLVGELSNAVLNVLDLLLDSSTIKLIIKINNTYYLDYLDLETLTHLFYAIDTIL